MSRSTMITSHLEAPGRLSLREAPIPEPHDGELVVRVDVALTCGTDLKTYRRGHPLFPFPTAIGHEFTGRVARVGRGVSAFKEGDAICAVPSAPCGQCASCRRGLENLCDGIHGRNMAWGAFAEFIRIPAHVAARNVFARPANLAPREAAFLEPLSCVVNGVERLELAKIETAVVLGAGPIGLLFVALLARRVPRVIVVGKRATRLEAARALGAKETIDVARESAIARVKELTSGEGACAVVECVGRPESWQEAIGIARKGGEVLLYGGCAGGVQVPIDARKVHYEAITIKGAFHFAPRDVRESLAILTRRELDVARLISDELPLAKLQDAIERLEAGECLKLAIVP